MVVQTAQGRFSGMWSRSSRIHAFLDKSISNPFACQHSHHKRNNVHQPSRQFKHDHHQGHCNTRTQIKIMTLNIYFELTWYKYIQTIIQHESANLVFSYSRPGPLQHVHVKSVNRHWKDRTFWADETQGTCICIWLFSTNQESWFSRTAARFWPDCLTLKILVNEIIQAKNEFFSRDSR